MSLSPLRQSTIKDYLFCSKSFYYKHVLQIPPAFRNASAVHGTVVHKVIEKLHVTDGVPDTKSLYQQCFDQEEQNGQDSHIPIFFKENKEKQIKKYTEEAVEMIEGYRSKKYNQDVEILLSEAQFTVKMGRAGIFTGTIDQLRKYPDGTLELLDLKTSQFKPDQAFLNTDYQFSIYSYALWQGTFKKRVMGIKPEDLLITWLHMRNYMKYKRASNGHKIGDPKGEARFHTSRTRKQLSDTKRDLSAIATCIRRNIFPRNPDQQRCGWCQFSSICNEDSKGSALNRNEVKEVKKLMEGIDA